MIERSLKSRQALDLFVRAVSLISVVIGLGALVWILYTVTTKGVASLDLAFFTDLPTPPGIEGGGLANAMLGTVLMTALAAVIAIPLGMAAGVYLSEFGRESKLANWVRFATNVVIGVPSIIIGIFVYTLMVIPMKTFSGYAGAASLAIIMLPIVVRTTEDMLSLVPNALRESALALGANQFQVTVGVVFRAAKDGMLTGVLLAVARASGETAPLLFTAMNSPYWLKGLNEPIANLTVTIFNYAMSPYADWQAKAWGASLLIMLGVLMLTVIARVFLIRQVKRR